MLNWDKYSIWVLTDLQSEPQTARGLSCDSLFKGYIKYRKHNYK